MQIGRQGSVPVMAGVLLLAMLLYTIVGALVCFVAGGSVNGWIFPVAAVMSAATVAGLFGIDRRSLMVTAVSFAAVLAAAWICSLLTDQSYDGNAYHGETIGWLLDGWNPFREVADTPTIWVNSYAKALEMAEASVSAFTGNMESGKVVNLMLAGAALLLIGGALRGAFPALPAKGIWIVTLLFGANPVVVTQIFTFYNDYALYCCMLIVAAMMLRVYIKGWSWLWASVALAATMIGMVTKFTHGFYLGMEWGAFLLLMCISRRSSRTIWRSVAVAASGAVVGLCVLGYHPYVTNTCRYDHPLYPLMGDNVEDIMSENTPREFRNDGRVANFVKSVCMVKRVTYDQRYGGFGPFMGPMLLLSLLLLAVSWRKWQALYVAFCLLAACFCFDQTWWARYIPFLWAVIPVSALASLLSRQCGRDRWTRIVRGVVYAGVLLTMPLCAVDAVWLKIEATWYRNTLYGGARRSGIVNVAIEPYDVHVRRRLDEAGLKFRIVPRCEIDTSRALFLVNDGFRGDIIELSPDVFQDVTSPGLRYRLLRMQERTLDFFDDMRPCD